MRKLESIFYFIGLALIFAGGSQLLRFYAFQPVSAASFSPSKPQIQSVEPRLEIPRLHISLPILGNDDPDSLAIAVGHITGTSPLGSLGNVGIAGHRDTAFRRLREIRIGDRILTLGKENVSYVVTTLRVVEPSDTSLLRESSSPLLTLVTCYPFNFVGPAPQRFVIQAQMMSN